MRAFGATNHDQNKDKYYIPICLWGRRGEGGGVCTPALHLFVKGLDYSHCCRARHRQKTKTVPNSKHQAAGRSSTPTHIHTKQKMNPFHEITTQYSPATHDPHQRPATGRSSPSLSPRPRTPAPPESTRGRTTRLGSARERSPCRTGSSESATSSRPPPPPLPPRCRRCRPCRRPGSASCCASPARYRSRRPSNGCAPIEG